MRYFVLYALPYITFLVFVLGCGYRLAMWLRSPVPLKIPVTPAPTTRRGIVARYISEILIFRTLFAGDKALWLASWVFHVTLAFVIGGHVVGFFLSEFVCELRGWTPSEYERFSFIAGGHLGVLILLSLLYLFVRRMQEERVRYISRPGDYFALLLLLAIVITGDCLRFFHSIRLFVVRDYLVGLITFCGAAAPAAKLFAWHFFLVNALVMYLPFGKLVHAGGIFFSPTHNQRDNARDQRHLNPWNEPEGAQSE